MRNNLFLFLLILGAAASAKANSHLDSASPIEGRWDITVDISGKPFPSWLEVTHSGFSTLVGQFVSTSGSARPISRVNFNDNKVSFSIPPQWETGSDLAFEAELRDDVLTGTITFPNGKKYSCSGQRAPTLRMKKAPVWGSPVKLFDGTDVKGWHPSGDKNQWTAENGILRSANPGSNLITDAVFTNFKLHVEFRYSENGNSGVYLRGRYEVQIVDDNEPEPWKGCLAAIYGFLPPNEVVTKKPGEWQSYDITLSGRIVTVIANGKTVISNEEIPGITGGALDSKEALPGPIMLQGDHEPIEYRNIVITPAR
jgi:Domain of Unknown Function (DUF1080)